MADLLLRFLRDESAHGMSELLLVAGTASLIIPSIGNVGAGLAGVFAKITKALH